MLPILQSTKARDPVCGMMVDPENSAGSAEYQGQKYYFCSKGCAAKFQADPEKYLHPQALPEAMDEPPAGSNTLARCIPKCARSGRDRVPYAAWRWSR